VKEIIDVHYLHIWNIGEKDIYFEAHINSQDMMISDSEMIQYKIERDLAEKFGINHVTLQFVCDLFKIKI